MTSSGTTSSRKPPHCPLDSPTGDSRRQGLDPVTDRGRGHRRRRPAKEGATAAGGEEGVSGGRRGGRGAMEENRRERRPTVEASGTVR
jgi:hypothetical protein